MITTFFVTLGNLFFSGIGYILPNSESLPTGISDALTYIGVAVNSVSYLFPVAHIFAALAVVVSYEAAIWIFHGLSWAWKRIPFIGK